MNHQPFLLIPDQQEYQNQINRLQNVVATQAPSVTAQSGLLQGTGGQLRQTGQQMGAAAGDIYKGIAEADQQAANTSGQGLLQTANLRGQMQQQSELTNAQLQQQANLQNAQLQQQAALANQKLEGRDAALLTNLIRSN